MKHAREEHYIANVPSDSYYRAQIRTLQDKLDKTQHEVELKDAYIRDLEASKRALEKKVSNYQNAMIGMMEDKFNV